MSTSKYPSLPGVPATTLFESKVRFVSESELQAFADATIALRTPHAAAEPHARTNKEQDGPDLV